MSAIYRDKRRKRTRLGVFRLRRGLERTIPEGRVRHAVPTEMLNIGGHEVPLFGKWGDRPVESVP